MKSYATLVALAFAAAANAAKFTNVAVNPEPGKPFELTWSDAQGPVTINLKNGPSGNLATVETLASGITGDSTTITLDASDLPADTYAFEIIDGTDVNYSVQFEFEGTGTAPSVTGSTTPSSTGSPSTTVSTTVKSTSSSSETASDTTSETASRTSSSRPSRTSDADESEETIPEDNGSSNLSPLALIFVTAAAMMYFN